MLKASSGVLGDAYTGLRYILPALRLVLSSRYVVLLHIQFCTVVKF